MKNKNLLLINYSISLSSRYLLLINFLNLFNIRYVWVMHIYIRIMYIMHENYHDMIEKNFSWRMLYFRFTHRCYYYSPRGSNVFLFFVRDSVTLLKFIGRTKMNRIVNRAINELFNDSIRVVSGFFHDVSSSSRLNNRACNNRDVNYIRGTLLEETDIRKLVSSKKCRPRIIYRYY